LTDGNSSTNPEVINIRGNGTVTLHTRCASGYSKPHYAQTRFKGRDETGEPNHDQRAVGPPADAVGKHCDNA